MQQERDAPGAGTEIEDAKWSIPRLSDGRTFGENVVREMNRPHFCFWPVCAMSVLALSQRRAADWN